MPYILLQVVLAPIVASLAILGTGGRIGKSLGWVAFASLLYAAFLLTSTGVGLYNGGSSVAESYVWAPSAGLTFGFLADNLSLPVALIIDLVCMAASVYSMPYMKRRFEAIYGGKGKQPFYLYYANLLLIVAGLLGVVLSTNLIELFLFVELMLIPTFFLISMYGYVEKEKTAIMYLIWNQLGAFVFLAGVALVYVAKGSFEIAALSAIQPSSIGYWIAGLILLGWLVKMAVFGLHMWLPQCEAEPPTSFASIMAVTSGVGAYVLVRLLVVGMPAVFQPFAFPLMVVAVITMFYGGAVTLAQTDVKYLYAWSGISQNAYSLLGIGSLTLLGASGGVFYFLSHIIGKFVLFSVAGILVTQTGLRDIRKMGGLAGRMPMTATLALLGTLVLSAVPPLSGFQAEWIMFAGIFGTGVSGSTAYLAVASLGLIATLFTLGYTIWPVRRIFFGPPSASLQEVKDAPWTMTLPVLALAVISVVIGIYPDLVFKPLYSYLHLLPILGR